MIPTQRNSRQKYRQAADHSYFLLVFFFVGKHNSYWGIFNLHWSTVSWRKKSSLTSVHFFKFVVVYLMDTFHGVFKQYTLLGFAHWLVFQITVKTKLATVLIHRCEWKVWGSSLQSFIQYFSTLLPSIYKHFKCAFQNPTKHMCFLTLNYSKFPIL